MLLVLYLQTSKDKKHIQPTIAFSNINIYFLLAQYAIAYYVQPINKHKEPTMMRTLKSALLALSLSLFALSPSMAADKENMLYLDTKYGRTVIELYPHLAPKHVERIKKLAREGFYDGIVFHRVIDGFMAQTGDPEGTGRGGSQYPDLPAEFSRERHTRGVTSMARASNPNSANSQFFIMFAPAPHLDGKYTVWGKVIAGMDHIDSVKKGSKSQNGTVINPDKIIKMQVAADEK